jgi:ABC-2 type transport system ATP-binding protein
VSLSGRSVQVVLRDESTYEAIHGAVAGLDLPLHSLDQRRHRVAELFSREAANVG